MEYKNIFEFKNRSIMLLALLAILPNIFGMLNVNTVWGFKIHFFQYFIFLAAVIYGPLGGLVSGAFGSLFIAMAMGNPYIIVGNVILGLLVGLFFRMNWNIVLAVVAAFVIQIPWLYYSDVYLVHMPINVVYGVIVALFFSNILWAIVTRYTYKRFIE